MVAFDTLQHFHVFPEGGGLMDQSPLFWHDLRICFALLAHKMDEEADSDDDDDGGAPMALVNIEDL